MNLRKYSPRLRACKLEKWVEPDEVTTCLRCILLSHETPYDPLSEFFL